MLKKISTLVAILSAILIFVVYKNINSPLNPSIVTRATINLPIKGNWTVNRYVFAGDSSISMTEAKEMVNKKAVFEGNEVRFNGATCKNPNFKVKVVDSDVYFENNYKINPNSLDINEKYLKVITVSSNNNFFDDFIQINDNLIMRYSDGLILFFTKDGTENNKSLLNNINEKNSRIISSRKQNDSTYKSGLLLGLRYKNEDTGEYSYRTLCISSSYNKILPVLQRKNILVPRKNGFWEVGINKKYDNEFDTDFDRDVIWGAPLMKSNSKTHNSNTVIRNIKNTNSQILFVGTDYISLNNEEVYYENGEQKVKNSYFSMLPLDNLNGKKMEFSKAFNVKDLSMLKMSAEKYLNKLNKSSENVNLTNLNTNWAITRRNGRWILRGRNNYGDFDIVYAAPNKVFTMYDELYPSFDVIKKQVPDAVDIYTSPNKDFIVVLTETQLKIFKLNNKNIGKLETTFELNQGEKVIMSEWTTGNYVSTWSKLFKK